MSRSGYPHPGTYPGVFRYDLPRYTHDDSGQLVMEPLRTEDIPEASFCSENGEAIWPYRRPRTTNQETRLLVTLASVTLLASTTFTATTFILETPETEVLRPALSEEESERDAHIRTAVTVGVVIMVVVRLAAMASSFNEAQRPLDYLAHPDQVKPSDLERAWKTASSTTSTVDDLNMVSSPSSEDRNKKSLPSTAKSTGGGLEKTDVSPDSDDGTE